MGESAAGAVVRGYLALQLQAMLSAEGGARRADPDSIHDMRVATRRLSNTIATYHKMLDETHARDLEARLRTLALQLGKVRDSDVLLQRLESEVDAQPSELILGPVRERLRARLRSESQPASAAVVQALNGSDYADLVADLNDLARARWVSRGQAAARPADEVLPKLVDRSYRKLARRAKAAAKAPPGDERNQALHRTRKAAKQLRYAAEVAEAAGRAKGHAIVALATNIQGILGEQHDSVVAANFLRELAQNLPADESAFTFGVLVGVEQGKARAAASAFESLWRTASHKR